MPSGASSAVLPESAAGAEAPSIAAPTESTANMVSELRKFGVGLVLAHQHLHQLEPPVRHAVLANMGTVVTFRLGPEDAEFFAREFEPVVTPLDLMSLRNRDIYLRLMIDGMPSRPFSATTLDPRLLFPRNL